MCVVKKFNFELTSPGSSRGVKSLFFNSMAQKKVGVKKKVGVRLAILQFRKLFLIIFSSSLPVSNPF